MNRTVQICAWRLALLGVALTAACKGNDVTTTPHGAITLAVAPTTMTVAAGSTDTLTVTVVSSGGFSGPVSVSASGAPSGVTVGTVTIPAGQTTGKLPVAVSSSATAGSSSISVQASASGVATQTATFTLTITAAPGFSLTPSPASISVQAGASGVDTISVARTGGFAGAVGLSVTGAPAKLTVALDSATLGGTRTLLRISADTALAAGSYTLTLHGNATGFAERTATLTVVVTASTPPAGDFTLTAAPANLSIQAGNNAVDTIAVARSGSFTGAVALSVTGAPAGITAAFDSASLGGTRTLLRIGTTSSLAAGSYTLTVHATATGIAEKTATVTVQVTAGSSGSGNVSWTFCGVAPIWVAAQDGTGPWTQLTSTTGTYSFNVTNRGGLAYVTGSATSGYTLTVFYATAQDFASQRQGAGQCGVTPGGKTVNGSVLGLGLTDAAMVTLGTATAFVSGAALNTFTLQNVPTGLVDLLAARLAIGGAGSFTTTKLFMQRGLQPADGSTLAPIDFGSAQAFDPVTQKVTIANRGTDNVFAIPLFVTANGQMTYTVPGQAAAVDTIAFPAIPTNQLLATDLHFLQVIATPPGAAPTSSRIVAAYFHNPADKTVTLGAALTGASASVLATTPYVRLGASYTPQPDYNTLWGALFSQGTGATTRTVNVEMTAGYAGTGPVALNTPDLSAAAGWSNTWALVTGVSTSWTVFGFGGFIPGGTPADGTTYKEAYQKGTITP